MKESLTNFYKYNASDEELFTYIRINAGKWNEESFIQMKRIVREVIKDYRNEEICEGYTEETYLSMIAERIRALN